MCGCVGVWVCGYTDFDSFYFYIISNLNEKMLKV